ncbi:MAG: hypothetical protein KKF62_00905 [Bacteroidetes bacterium]|nr:hypothetical protein [Bacteroidota bacterium]MBU1114249.1 hypothetical protein [Bacteroidota bacterium]MBU1797687.1 hypothetical protein [Bacteroidota bacterium]
MYSDRNEILLHDYFDNLLSEEEQTEFEDCLLDNIDLAIELGKLKNLQRNLNNLPSNFTPQDTVIENIINSLLSTNLEVKNIDKKAYNNKRTKPEKKKSKTKRELSPKTKYILKRLLIPTLILIVLSVSVVGYYGYIKMNKTTPWFVNILKSKTTAKFETNELIVNSTFETTESQEVEIVIKQCGKIELLGASKIEVLNGEKSLNSIFYYFGNFSFFPDLNNQLFELNYYAISIKSTNSIFSISENKGNTNVMVVTNFITVKNDNLEYRIPANHQFNISGKNEVSIPINDKSSEIFFDLINSYSLTKNHLVLGEIIKTSTSTEAFTLFSLLPQVTPYYRDIIINKLQKMVPMPSNINKENILILDQLSLESWWDAIYLANN